MSIAKIKVNNSARATFRYAAGKQGAQIIGGNAAPWVERDQLSDEQLRELVANATQKFMVSINRNDRVEKAVGHISVSFPPGEDLDDQQLSDYSEKYLAAMILTSEQPELLRNFNEPEFREAVENFRENELHKYSYSVVRHTDEPHPHAHIVYSRINLETEKAIGKEFERYRSQEILRDLERQYGLEVLPNSWEVGRRAESIGQIKKGEKTGIVSVQKRLQDAIELAAIDCPTMPQLIERLQDAGIGVKVNFTRTGKTNGISYVLDDVPIAGNKLGNRYSLPGLAKHLNVSYEAERDNDDIRELCLRVVVKLEEEEIKTEEEKQGELQVEVIEASINLSPPQVELPSSSADSTDATDSTDEPPSDAPTDEQPIEITLPVVPPLMEVEPELVAPADELKAVVEPFKVETQPTIELTPEQQQAADQKQFYQNLWQKLSKEVIEKGVPESKVPLGVAIVGLKRKHSPQAVRAIVGQSPAIQKVLQDEGTEAAYKAALDIVEQAQVLRKKERDSQHSESKGKGAGGRQS